MKKHTIKYTAVLTLGITFVIFLFFLIENYLIRLLSPNLTGTLTINFIFALIVAIIISEGIFLFTPVLSDTMATLRRMLRVESLSNPLLMKISSEAPGTYHHSLNVSTLAQKAAKAIGADSLLVRTSAYYHDLGKLENPYSFVENQSGKEVPSVEDADSIRRNAKEIIAHVDDGVKMAEEAHLPANVVDLIREHHGTTRALYFFRLAKERGLKIKKTDFRYLGPTPQSKEAVVLMLADCVEAIARSMPRLEKTDLSSIVKNTIAERLREKQFDQAGLAEGDLEKIELALISTLDAIYHQRMEYDR